MPSTYSVSNLRVLLSSTVITPSLPTFSMTSAMSLPISSSAAEMAATWAILVWSWTGVDMAFRLSTTACTPRSIPLFRRRGFAPAVTFLKPSLTMAWASTVAVVVPSPAMSLVLVVTFPVLLGQAYADSQGINSIPRNKVVSLDGKVMFEGIGFGNEGEEWMKRAAQLIEKLKAAK